mmetsp:Transcript_54982/g.98017  ORF Transcript_54982/g.98017 Transcript_54982/m.98017 type:complete len:217 (+) Transcript_54982:178-828(+)
MRGQRHHGCLADPGVLRDPGRHSQGAYPRHCERVQGPRRGLSAPSGHGDSVLTAPWNWTFRRLLRRQRCGELPGRAMYICLMEGPDPRRPWPSFVPPLSSSASTTAEASNAARTMEATLSHLPRRSCEKYRRSSPGRCPAPSPGNLRPSYALYQCKASSESEPRQSSLLVLSPAALDEAHPFLPLPPLPSGPHRHLAFGDALCAAAVQTGVQTLEA